MTTYAVTDLILSPRQVATGAPAGAALENLDTHPLGDGCLCYVSSGDGQGQWQFRRFDSTSVPDGVSVVAPIAGPGRWIRMDTSSRQSTYWVLSTGSDANSGVSEDTALATIDEALRRIGPVVLQDTTIILGPPTDPDGWDTEKLWEPRLYQGSLLIDGSEFLTEVEPAETTSAWAAASYTYTFAGAPGWTVNALVGQWLEYVSGGSAAFPAGQKRTILANTADTVTVAEPHGDSTLPAPGAGLVMRVVAPATRINCGAYATGDDKALYGGSISGTNAGGGGTTANAQRNVLRLRGLEFAIPTGAAAQSLELGGAVVFEGVQYTKSAVGITYQMRAEAFQIASGEFITGDPNLVSFGWCLSTRDRAGGTRLPRITLQNGSWAGYWCGGSFLAFQSAQANLRRTGRYDGLGYTAGFPEATIYCGKNCYVFTNLTTVTAFFVGSIPGGRCFDTEAGFIELYVPVQQFASGGFARARQQGSMDIAANPVAIGGATGLELVAVQAGLIRLLGATGATFGAATASQINANVRPAGAWAVGEIIPPGAVALPVLQDDGSRIYRSA